MGEREESTGTIMCENQTTIVTTRTKRGMIEEEKDFKGAVQFTTPQHHPTARRFSPLLYIVLSIIDFKYIRER